jgi:hypothetical protein
MELSRPEVVRCFFHKSCELQLPAMELRWSPDAERIWYLPDCVCLKGPAPHRFGITIHRHGEDAYRVRVLWNRLFLSWDNLARVHLMSSSIALVLNALGTDLWYLLNQPIAEESSACARAA